MPLRLVLLGIAALLSVSCGSKTDQEATAPSPRGGAGAVLTVDFGWKFEPGTFILSRSDKAQSVSKTIELDSSKKARFTTDGPGGKATLRKGTWDQTYDGIRLELEASNPPGAQTQFYFKNEPEGLLDKDSGERYQRR